MKIIVKNSKYKNFNKLLIFGLLTFKKEWLLTKVNFRYFFVRKDLRLINFIPGFFKNPNWNNTDSHVT